MAGKKRKVEAARLEETDQALYGAFRGAANSLSQLYTLAMGGQRLSFQAGERHAMLAFFTTRQIEPFEELTWDYGIDFDDVDHPVKAFKCRCGSELCRDKKRSSRSKSRALLLL